jgi:hypothetical protein
MPVLTLKFLLERLVHTTSNFIFSLLYNVQPQELHSVWCVVKQLVAWDKDDRPWDKNDRPWAQHIYQELQVKQMSSCTHKKRRT